MLQFLPGYAWFAIAGAAAATGPVVIHLLNRRRFRVVRWGAMDFLRQAIRRNRRILELRDLLLLVLRTLAVLLFGLALARPFVPANASIGWRVALPAGALALACGLAAATLWSATMARKSLIGAAVVLAAAAVYFGGAPYWSASADAALASTDPSQPVHAILLIDNSLSMSYALERSLLDEAKTRALRLIDRLPEGSHVAVLPVCGPHDQFSLDPHPAKDDARAAVERIVAVDRQATSAAVIALAREACQQAPEFPAAAKRVVLFTDRQEVDWPAAALAERIADLPELQMVDVSATDPSNAWVASVELEDGVADTQTPTKIIARIRYDGREPRDNVQVSLWVDDAEVASQTIDRLEDAATREIVFHHQFDLSLSPGETRHVGVRVVLAPDRLTMDDVRCLAATVVAALPVVFVDELGAEGEQPSRQVFGETRPLRRILAPTSRAAESPPPLVEVRHTTIDHLDRKLLSDARLVVVAGVEQPGDAAVDLLRDYVAQGGQLIVAAGANFDAAKWTEQAWRTGAGILPLPLDGTVGQSLEDDPAQLDTFHIAADSLAGQDEFHIAGESAASQADFYRDPLFFKAIRVDASPRRIGETVAAESKRIAEQLASVAESDRQLAEWRRMEADGGLSAADAAARDAELSRRQELQTRWLAWPSQRAAATLPSNQDAAARARAAAPRVLARFTNGLPFLAERRIDRGDVLFVATSVRSGWNTWPASYTMFLADRLMRRRLERTLPVRNVSTGRDVSIPVDPDDVEKSFAVTRPDGTVVAQDVEALDADTYGVTIGGLYERGFYRLERLAKQNTDAETNSKRATASEASRRSNADSQPAPPPPPRTPPPTLLAANGPAEESQLAAVDRQKLVDGASSSGKFRWIAPGELVSIEGAAVRGQNLWWWLVATVAACLIVEMTALAWPGLNAAHS
ncbi:MAG: BatA domain-containing protein [Pirellulales bacterium]